MSFRRFFAGVSMLIFFAGAMAACSDGYATDGEGPLADTLLTVTNRSQFEVVELRIHSVDRYHDAPNLLATPLAVDAVVDIEFHSGYYVTIFRNKTDVGPVIAITTGEALDIFAEGTELWVFDDAFRLVPPAAVVP